MTIYAVNLFRTYRIRQAAPLVKMTYDSSLKALGKEPDLRDFTLIHKRTCRQGKPIFPDTWPGRIEGGTQFR